MRTIIIRIYIVNAAARGRRCRAGLGAASAGDRGISRAWRGQDVIFVDTNVIMYAVGRPHPLREPAREIFLNAGERRAPLCTSAEVLQELLHAYLPVARLETLESAMAPVSGVMGEIWPLETDDVIAAHELHAQFPALGARDLCHLACCRRRGVSEIKAFDQTFGAVCGRG